MNKKIIIWVGVIAGIGGLGYAFYAFYKRQMTLAMSYCFKIATLKFLKLDKNQTIIDVNIKVRNQSDLRIDITNYNFDVYINDKKVTHISNPTSVDLLANAVSIIPLRIEFSPSKFFDLGNVISLLSSAITDYKNFKIRISGSLGAKLNFINIKDLPIDMTMNLAEILSDENKVDANKLTCNIV